MQFSFGFSTCVFIAVLITCHKFSSSEANDVDPDTKHARITRLGESPIGSQYRERRSKADDLSTNKIDDNNDEEENDDQSEKGDDNEDDGNDSDDDEEDDEDEEEDNKQDELTRKKLHENLAFLKGAKKSLKIYSEEEESPLDRLVTESSDLAKEVSTVFRKLAKREAELTNEMEHLKNALDEAVTNLKKTIEQEEKAKQQQSQKEAGSNDKNGGNDNDNRSEQRDTQTLKRQRRNFDYNRHPYRACVSLEPMMHPDAEHHHNPHLPRPPPPPGVSVQEYMPSRNFPQAQHESEYSNTQQQYSYQQQPPVQRPPPQSANSQAKPIGEVEIKTITQKQPGGYKESRTYTQVVTNNQQGSNQQGNLAPPSRALPMTSQSLSQFQNQQQQQFQSRSGSNAEGVDLSEVYWLKLDPTRRQEALHDKLDTLLKRKQNAGKDVLLVPVDHGFQSPDEVRDSFLRSVRVRPKALSSKLFRKLRSLQVHIL